MPQQSLFDKVWHAHQVRSETADTPGLLYIDLHLVHEVTSPQAFDVLRERGIKVRRPQNCLATLDHSTPTLNLQPGEKRAYVTAQAELQVKQLEINCAEFGIELHGFDSDQRGIVHVMGPELGATHPGMTVVCGDSHTSTHGAFGALAFGIGTTEVGHVLASQCLLQRKPKTMAINIEGELSPAVSAKDLILHIIGKIGVDGGTGYVLEYRGSTVSAMTMEQRMTVCNMSIEAGARAGMIAPDATTFSYLKNRPKAPQGAAWDAAVTKWQALASDKDAKFDEEVFIDASAVAPTLTYGTHPGMVAAINAPIPAANGNADIAKALSYMGLQSGLPLQGTKIDVVFIGSCTNGRLSDLRDAADLMKGQRIAKHVRMLVVPGSESVKREAEAEGLDKIFLAAGAEWREPGCSMCIAMNGDFVAPGQYAVSTSNRNFEGRQGKGSRTFLASPVTAAASAIAGSVADPRALLQANKVGASA